MNIRRGKSVNFFQIIFILVFLSYGSFQLGTVARIPLEMTRALFTGKLYTGELLQFVDEYGDVHRGISYQEATGVSGFIPAERLSALTLDYFSQVDQTVLLDDAGGTFWFTYEDLGIAYVVLLAGFFALRIGCSLLLSLFGILGLLRDQATRNGKRGIQLFFKPLRLLLFGGILLLFQQYRIFGYEEEIDFFQFFIVVYGVYSVVVLLLQVRSVRRNGAVSSKIEPVFNAYTSKDLAVVDVVPTSTSPETKHNNDLIQRQKRTFKHKTSRSS